MVDNIAEDKRRRYVGLYFTEGIAKEIKTQMIKNDSFLTKFNLGKRCLTIGNHQVFPNDLFNFFKSIANGKKAGRIKSPQGEHISLSGEMSQYGEIKIFCGGEVHCFPGGGLFSKNKKFREKILAGFFSNYTCPISIKNFWHARCAQKPLTGKSYQALMDDLCLSHEYILNGIREQLDNKASFFPNLVPDEETLLRLLGDAKDCATLNEYSVARDITQEEILRDNFCKGLQLIGPGSLYINPEITRIILERVKENEENFNIFSEFAFSGLDPYTLALCFDVCVLGHADVRFIEIGAKILERTLAPQSEIALNFSIAIGLVLPALLSARLLQNAPLFFRRLASWTWAGFIARVLSEYSVEREKMMSELHIRMLHSFCPIGVLDGHEAPYWHPFYASNDYVFGGIRRRFIQSLLKLEVTTIPDSWGKFFSEVDEIELYTYFPSMLDEFIKIPPFALDGKELEAPINKYIDGKNGIEYLKSLNTLSRISHISEELLEKVKLAGNDLKHQTLFFVDMQDARKALDTLCYLAAVNRDVELATCAVDLARKFNCISDSSDEFFEFFTILNASPAFASKEESYKFIQRNMERLAYNITSPSQAKICEESIAHIETVFPGLTPYLSKSKAGFALAKNLP